MESPTEHHSESSFILTTVVVIGALVAFTLIIVVAARMLSADDSNDPQLTSKILAENTAPIGSVTTDASQLPKAKASTQGPQSGAQVVDGVCSGCHGSGMLGAPKIGDKADWSKRLAAAGGKVADLAAVAIKGKGSMPARGGDASLSDDEIKAAIQEMLKRTGVSAN